jgi:AcrR family transcriptional regulator
VTTQKATDRRVARTRRLLRDALHSLIREKNYDEIVVKEIIDRADVGRSAFYTHFRDKDDLLASSIEDLLADVPVIKSANPENTMEALLWFSLPIFEHIEGQPMVV